MATRAEFEQTHNPDEEVRHLRAQLAKLQKDMEDYKVEQGGLEHLFRVMTEEIAALPAPAIDYKPPRKSKITTPVVLCSHWTDWHDGAVQVPDEVEGFNAFNPDILARRLRNCVRDQLEWTELHRKSYTINTSHDLVTGDMISGGIHQELLVTNAWPEPVQAIKAGELLAEILAMKAPHFQNVIVDFLVVDNHGRLTKKPQAAEAGLNHWNYIVGHYARERLRDFRNIDFRVHPFIQHITDVGGRKYLLTHGDRVKGWAGFPYYGIARQVGRESTKRMQRALTLAAEPTVDVPRMIGTMFHKIVMGHWHAPLVHPWYMIGGSAQGTTTYDHGEGRHAEPIQCAWMVHPRHGEFDRTDWLLRDDEC